jgi:glutathione S-transferase
MILIGQFDSPFVRRVGIALKLYGAAFEHRPWSTFGDADQIAPYNPLRRVPTLVLDDGAVLVETLAILDWLDETAGPTRALLPRTGPQRRDQLQICALAGGLCDKAVALIYERALHEATSQTWIERCRDQVRDALATLETRRGAGAFIWGDGPGHADIALACALRFVTDAHPGLFDPQNYPALARHLNACEALPVFGEISQPFIPPA